MSVSADVAIIMGSQSDWETMRHAADTLEALGISFDARIVSAPAPVAQLTFPAWQQP
jgi:5-(carboxyamino)imidazole ribonucleotide mutase